VALDGDVDWGKLLFSLGLVDGDRPLGFMGTAWIEILELEAFLQGGAWLSGAEMCMLDPDFLRGACARFRCRNHLTSCGGSSCKETESVVTVPANGHAHTNAAVPTCAIPFLSF